MRSSLHRIVVIGSAGSGKTTLASKLGLILNVPHIELDRLHWGPDWSLPSIDGFTSIVLEALGGNRWVADGNYSTIRHVLWSLADTILWMDYPLQVIFFSFADEDPPKDNYPRTALAWESRAFQATIFEL